MTIYSIDPPWESSCEGGRETVRVIAYNDDDEEFIALYDNGQPFGLRAMGFTPPPPIPAAARKPQAGEVWWCDGEAVLFMEPAEPGVHCRIFRPLFGVLKHELVHRGDLERPATPEEAEPFRPLLEGLKRSLGED